MASFKLKVQRPSEDESQISLVTWLKWKGVPVIHIPNQGVRSFATARWLESMGLWRGASDLFIARPRLSQGVYYGGFWVEMKSFGKKPTKIQEEFLDKMAKEGYKTAWFDNWDDARVAIEEYLGI